MWLFPVLMVTLGLVFAWRHYGHLVDRLFMAVVLAAAAMSVYGACSSMFHALQTHYQWFTPNMNDTSLWNAFGAEWVLMLVCAALFAATLGLFEARWLKRR
jgi:hypothetical protein